MKASAKRRRSKAQIMEEKEAALRKETELKEKLAAWSQLEAALEKSEREKEELLRKTNDVQRMFDDGILKCGTDGRYQAVVDPAESEHIRFEVSMSKRKAAMTAVDAEQINANLERLNGDIDDDGLE